MSKRSSRVADRMAFFRQALEEEKKVHTAKRLTTPSNKVMSSPTNSSSTSTTKQTHTNQENRELVKTTESTTPTTESTAPTTERTTKKVEKVASQRKEPRVLKKKPELKRQMSVSSLVLTWCQDVTKGYEGVNIQNFSGSFANGLAFCALIHKFHPDKFDFDSLDAENREYNVKLAIEVGTQVGIPAILEPKEFLRMKRPEPRSVQCYVQMIFSKYKPKDLDMSNLRIA